MNLGSKSKKQKKQVRTQNPRSSSIADSENVVERVAVINGLPISLTEYSPRRKDMLEMLNEKLLLMLNQKNTNLLIITINEDRQMTK